MKKRLFFAAAAAFLAATALFFLYRFEDGVGLPCPFYLITGWYCSGCGTTRALRSILHLNFYKAFRYNSLFTILFPFLAFYFISVFLSLTIYGKDKISPKIPVSVPILVIGIAFVFGILRNIPLFSFLAPIMI